MAVLKQTSPTRVPVAPNDSPSKYRPSSRARSVRTSLRIIDLVGGFSNLLNLWPRQSCLRLREPVRQDCLRHAQQKTWIDVSIRVLNFYPAGAVQVILPFPFVKGG